jgi:hypothetical protein
MGWKDLVRVVIWANLSFILSFEYLEMLCEDIK